MNITLGAGNQVFALQRGAAQDDTITDFKSIHFTATLDGNQEVPGRVIAAAATATGALNFDQTRFAFTVTTTGIDVDGLQTPGNALDDKTDLHIHQAPAGAAGPIVYDDDTDGSFVANGPAGIMTGVWDAGQNLAGANLTALLTDAAYLNVHTTEFGGGPAIRGQILKVDDGLDRIDLTAFNIGSFAALQAIASDTAGSAVIQAVFNGVASSVTLAGVGEAQLTAAHFVFAGAVAETINGTGLADDLFGAGGDDALAGSGGVDRLFGEDGNDTLNGGAGADAIIGGGGSDTASYAGASARVRVALDNSIVFEGDALGDTFSSIARLIGTGASDVLIGDLNGNIINGGSSNDTIRGQAGNDILRGDAGGDNLGGGLGDDKFSFLAVSHGGDTITDFRNLAGNNDSFQFKGSSFGGLAAGALAANRFTANATGLATTADHRFIYETDTGILRHDSNGTGAGGVTVIATLTGAPTLTVADFSII